MFLSLILTALLLGGAGYFIKMRYDAVLARIKEVEAKRKIVNQALNERHKLVKQILQQAKEKGLSDPSVQQLVQLRGKVKEAHESQDDDAMVQAEVLISENAEALVNFAKEQDDLKSFVGDYQKVNENLSTVVKAYHDSIVGYDEMIEQFAESVLIAVFEKDLFKKFPYFELSEDDDEQLTDDFV